MIRNKRIIGVCITKIHDLNQIIYLIHLHSYAQKHDYNLVVFNNFSDFNDHNTFHYDSGAIYDLINFDIIDALVIHTKSFCDKTLAESIVQRANSYNIPILPESSFLPNDSDVDNCQNVVPDSSCDASFKFHHAITDSMLHEDLMYAWLAQTLTVFDINELYSHLSGALLSDSYLCLNNNFIDLLINSSSQKTGKFSDELIVISSQPSSADTDKKVYSKLSDIIPSCDNWPNDTSSYILNTIHAENKVYGYYAIRTDNFSATTPLLKRIISVLNLAFRMVSNQFRHADTQFNIKQALMADTDSHLPLNLLIEKNLFFYHFQPIVNAHNGTIFAYEALMRTDPVIGMSPLEVIDAASTYGRLYDIEKATMWNTLAYINEYQEPFTECKLFVNSIPAYMLNSEDWDELVNKYGHLMDKLVIEMTEQTEMDNDRISVIRNRLKQNNIALAIDDYGTGFSNISNLIRYNPNYVKIDRSLVEHIQDKPRIQKLVAGIIEFVHENGFFALAEGVETHEELKTMIALGSDLIQGYYLAKPTSYILREIPEALQNEITELNRMRSGYEVRVYRPREDEIVDLARITTEHYNALLIESERIVIQGVPGTAINCPITIQDGLKTHITLKNVSITTEKEVPLIDLGNSTNVTLTLEGENEIINRGIRVPQSSSLHLTGEGSLHIHSEMLNSYGIGNDRDSSYGNIHIDFTGALWIDISGENSVAIGGGKNTCSSVISIQNTRLRLKCSANNCVGIGNFDGNCIIDIRKCNGIIEIASANAVGIGSVSGSANILLEHYKISIIESGIGLCGLGVLNGGSGNLIATNGSVTCDIRGRNIVCCGSDHGTLDCTVVLTTTKFYCEGTVVTGIGDINGSGNVSLRDSNLNMTILARENLDIGSKQGKLETINIQKNIKVNE